jgi:hypothetical protein
MLSPVCVAASNTLPFQVSQRLVTALARPSMNGLTLVVSAEPAAADSTQEGGS